MSRRASGPDASESPWRLLIHPPAAGRWNMAVDESLLEVYAGPDPPPRPTLRLYGWKPAALSLGRSQPAAGSHDPDFLRARSIDLVRRPTGGRAVLHEHERTYAVIGALRRDPFPGGVLDTYRRISMALLEALSLLGVTADAVTASPGALEPGSLSRSPLCFAAPSVHEITTKGLKIVGSAQLRRHGAFLQHGSILVRADARRLGQAAGAAAGAARFTGLESALGRRLTLAEVDRALVAGFESIFGARMDAGELTSKESCRATELQAWKYESAAWTLEGRVGGREQRWGP